MFAPIFGMIVGGLAFTGLILVWLRWMDADSYEHQSATNPTD